MILLAGLPLATLLDGLSLGTGFVVGFAVTFVSSLALLRFVFGSCSYTDEEA